LFLDSPQARRQGNVVIDRHRQTDRQRKDDADAAAQRIDVLQVAGIQPVEADFAGHAHSRGEHVHAVDRLEERGLAGVGGANDAEDLVLANLQVDILQCHRLAVTDGQVLDRQLGPRRRGSGVLA
jgi:hypothetical protein